MYLDIMTTILILVYLPTWGFLATWPLFIFAWVLELFALFVCAILENLIFQCQRSMLKIDNNNYFGEI